MKSSHIMVSHIAVHPLLISIRSSILHLKENHKQACSRNALLTLPVPWNRALDSQDPLQDKRRCYKWNRLKFHESTKSRHTAACCVMRNSHLGALEQHLSPRVWTDSSGQKIPDLEMVLPHSSLKGNQNLPQISGVQCKSHIVLFCPKIKNSRGIYLHQVIVI